MGAEIYPVGKARFDERKESLRLEGFIRKDGDKVSVDNATYEFVGAKQLPDGRIDLSESVGFRTRTPEEIKAFNKELEDIFRDSTFLERLWAKREDIIAYIGPPGMLAVIAYIIYDSYFRNG